MPLEPTFTIVVGQPGESHGGQARQMAFLKVIDDRDA